MVGAIQSGLSTSTDVFAQMREKMFAKLDGDGDGQIDLASLTEELQASTETDPGKARFLEDLKAADTDGDGMVSEAEFNAMKPPEPPPLQLSGSAYRQDAELTVPYDVSGSLLDLLG